MAFVLRLTDEESAELERRRAAGGFRSLNETVKAWLAPEQPMPPEFLNAAVKDALRRVQRDMVVPSGSVEALLGRPTPKPGSLLKKR